MNYYEQLDLNNIPKHIGIIMDGNGRWAKNRKMPRTFGHKEGTERVIEIVEAAYKINVKSLTLYAFSISGIKVESQGWMARSLASGAERLATWLSGDCCP